MEHIQTTSANIANENLDKLRKVFPQFVKDGQIDFDALKKFFVEQQVVAGEEKYGLNWVGKNDAFNAIRTPSTGTLTPQPEQSKNWDSTENLFIEGDNLEVLKLLQAHYRNSIKMIYIDPPYNTGHDFIYKDNFVQNRSDYYERTGQTQDGVKLTANPESNGRYHSDWLTMMYPRLFLGRNLLKDDGVIFVSIDDNEVVNLRLIMDEIFGEENFVAQMVWAAGRKNDSRYISISHEYILIYVRNGNYLSEQKTLWREQKRGLESIYATYNKLKNEYGNDYKKIEIGLSDWYSALKPDQPAKNHSHYSKVDENGIYFAADISWPGGGGPVYDVLHPITKKPCSIPSRGWMFSDPKKMQEAIMKNKVHFGIDETFVPCIKSYLSDREAQVPYSVFYQDGRAATKRLRNLLGGDYFEHPKDETIIRSLVEYISQEDKEGLYLDFFAGSGTAAHAIMDLNSEDNGNRKWICVQLPEKTDEKSEASKAGFKTIADIARERIRRAGDKIVEHHEKMERFEMVNGELIHSDISKNKNLDIGFKSFVLDQSNYRQWEGVTEEDGLDKFFTQSQLFIEKPLVDKYDEKSVVFEILVKEGFDLNSEVRQEKMKKLDVWVVTDKGEEDSRKIIVSFAEKLPLADLEEIGLSEHDMFVCFDHALDDTTKVNLVSMVNLKTM